ncbi:unnamed protein product [Brassica rapa]|uniref:Uncharacterized protein n=1 Tax=Brassica campestris TaxID=3711 RepID=A0A3P6A4L8_BRACM|nr:unnamed protein product [Brassica rapa]VDC82173.1 unnamed protein product [Brassica rapa]
MDSPHSNLLAAADPPPVTDEQNRDDVPIEKAEKPRTFPFPLSEETDGNDDDVDDLIKDSSKLSLEHKKSSLPPLPPLPPRALSKWSSQHPNLCKHKATDSLKPRKHEEVEITKRKSSKNMFKSEKEFFELMLKYQRVISERDSAITVRDKLESLCRELQRQNKMLMEEFKRVSTEEQTLRSDLSTKFQEAINVVELSHKQP